MWRRTDQQKQQILVYCMLQGGLRWSELVHEVSVLFVFEQVGRSA